MSWIDVSALEAFLGVLCACLVVLAVQGHRANRRFQLLSEVAVVSNGVGSLEETSDAICAILVPGLADFCAIDLIEGGTARRAALSVAPGTDSSVERRLRERKPSVPQRMVEGHDTAALTPRFFERMTESALREVAHDDDDLEFIRGLGVRSAITLALKTRGQIKGTLTLVTWSRRYGPGDERLARILSSRIALALDNSGLFSDLERAQEARSEIAETLQHGLLPAPLPDISGWSLAAMYRPAGAENEVGGDFYDAFPVKGGWMLVIGDVTGRGARAASITALGRYTLRTAAMLTDDPLVALATLNRALLSRGDTSLCSIAAVVLSEDPERPARIAVAGHPPPLLVDGDSVGEAAGTDPVLGAIADADWRIEYTPIEPGQQLVLVTDGVIDAGGPQGRFGEARLRAELAGASNPADAVQRLEAALRSFTEGALDDDAAILVVARAGDARRPAVGTAMSMAGSNYG